MKDCIVVKFGGHAMSGGAGAFAASIAQALSRGVRVVVVHGGGPQINSALKGAGIESKFVGGFRVTDAKTMAIVEEVLANQVGPQIVADLNANNISAQALSGRVAEIIFAKKRMTLLDGTPEELGFVGEIESVRTAKIDELLAQGIVPVISPIGTQIYTGVALNINADSAAAAIAAALKASELIVMTDVAGIYRNWPDTNSLISQIGIDELTSIQNTFEEGMAPKAAACIDAIKGGARSVRIIDGRDPLAFQNALLHLGGTLVSA